ncbi:MAG TPA: hypothetical protein PK295_00330 [Candidatus Magasanikbacteria bacterium]|nr:hypothetical protein [Candidatus Magasanikbacteria bacterium]
MSLFNHEVEHPLWKELKLVHVCLAVPGQQFWFIVEKMDLKREFNRNFSQGLVTFSQIEGALIEASEKGLPEDTDAVRKQVSSYIPPSGSTQFYNFMMCTSDHGHVDCVDGIFIEGDIRSVMQGLAMCDALVRMYPDDPEKIIQTAMLAQQIAASPLPYDHPT